MMDEDELYLEFMDKFEREVLKPVKELLKVLLNQFIKDIKKG